MNLKRIAAAFTAAAMSLTAMITTGFTASAEEAAYTVEFENNGINEITVGGGGAILMVKVKDDSTGEYVKEPALTWSQNSDDGGKLTLGDTRFVGDNSDTVWKNINGEEAGNVTVTATYDGKYSASKTIKVSPAPKVYRVKIDTPEKAEVEVDKTITLSAKVYEDGEELKNAAVKWLTVNSSDLVEVNASTGAVTGKAEGTAAVTARYIVDETIIAEDTINIKVTKTEKTYAVTIETYHDTSVMTNETFPLQVFVEEVDGDIIEDAGTVVWTTSDASKAIITPDIGEFVEFKALAAGQVTITAIYTTDYNTFTGTITFDITDAEVDNGSGGTTGGNQGSGTTGGTTGGSQGGGTTGGSHGGGTTSGTTGSTTTTTTTTKTETVSEKAVKTITDAKDGSSVTIELNKGETKIGKSVLSELKGRDVKVEFKLPDGVTWEINGKDVTNAIDIDFNVTLDSKGIPETKVTELAGEKKTEQFSLEHDGDLGFIGKINLPVSKEYNGQYANLYYYNTRSGELEFIDSSKISGGKVGFVFNHASDYLMIFDTYAYSDDVSAAAGSFAETETSQEAPYADILIITALMGVSALVIRRRIAK